MYLYTIDSIDYEGGSTWTLSHENHYDQQALAEIFKQCSDEIMEELHNATKDLEQINSWESTVKWYEPNLVDRVVRKMIEEHGFKEPVITSSLGFDESLYNAFMLVPLVTEPDGYLEKPEAFSNTFSDRGWEIMKTICRKLKLGISRMDVG